MKGKICCNILFACLLICFFSSDIQGQRLKSRYWERNWENFPRPVYNYGIIHFTAVKRVVSRKYFSTNSGYSGELYQKYYQFQFPSQAEIDENSSITIRIPPRQRLLDIDYRVWKDGLLIYEARPGLINSQVPSHLINSSLHSDSFNLELAYLEPECTVELIISCQGVPLPYQLFFSDDMPIEESVQELVLISESPLRYQASSAVEHEEFEEWDDIVYTFKVDNLPAKGALKGIDTRALQEANVLIDWQDLVYYYDRQETETWPDLLSHLFYEGLVRDYSVSRNSLSAQLGWQQFYGPWQRPLRFYRLRDDEIVQNEIYAEGNWRLSRAYADRWLVLEDFVQKVKEDSSYTFLYALQQMHALEKKAIKAQIEAIPEEPKIFTEYGLAYSFYQKLFKHFKIPYRLALIKSAAQGPILEDYVLPWQFQARALAYRLNAQDDWHYIFAGPILGDFADIDEIPSPLTGAQVLLFNPRDSLSRAIDTLHFKPLSAPNFIRQQSINFNKSFSFYRSTGAIFWDGVFRSSLLQDYILGDSLKYLLSSARSELPARHYMGDSISKLKPYRQALPNDSVSFVIPLKESIYLESPSPARVLCLPYLVKAEWDYDFTNLPEDYRYQIQSAAQQENEDFSFALKVQEIDPSHLKLTVAIEIRRLCYDSDSLNRYLQILSRLNEGVKITFWKN